METLQALIFDLDGVLIDTEPLHTRAKRLAFAEFGLAVPDNLYDAFRGRSDEDMAREMVREYGSGGLAWETVVARKHELFASLEDEIMPVPGALDFLRAAKADAVTSKRRFGKLALCTSATERNQRYALDRFGFAPFFDAVVHAGMLSRTKPHPEPYLMAAEMLGLPAAECLVVEDSRNGILSAKAAGCRVAAITTSFTRVELEDTGPQGADIIVGSFAELAITLKM